MSYFNLEDIQSRLIKLERFIDDKNTVKPGIIIAKIRRIFNVEVEDKKFSESEILKWVADCVAIFTELNVSDVIIANFLDFFRFKMDENNNEIEKRIGPFVTVGRMSKEYWLSNIVDFNYTKIAFECAKKNLEKIEDENRLIPKYLPRLFKSSKIYKQIGFILESLEDSYINADVDGIVTKSFNLIEEILNVDEDFKKSKSSIKEKLESLIGNKVKLEKFGVDVQIINALNNFRVIRNKKIVHNKVPVKSSIPMISAISIASLSILFLEIVFTSNRMIKND